MARDARKFYDDYWREREPERTRARSQRRAELAVRLLRAGGVEPAARPRPLRLLELGCGPGWALEVFAAAGFEAAGADVSALAVEETRRRGLSASLLDIERDALPGGQDVIAALEVLEHLADPLSALRSMRRALAEGGTLLLSLPNELHLLRRLEILIGRSPLGGHDDPHLRHFDDRLARRMLAEAGLRLRGRAADGLVPPRWATVKRCTEPLARWFPRLFGISLVYWVEPEELR